MKGAKAAIIGGVLILSSAGLCSGGNIDPYNDGSKYAYGENVGWLNFDPDYFESPGVTVTDTQVTGYVWCENVGWINLAPSDSDPCTGISNDGTGLLSGFAWGENVGWIDFNPTVYNDDTDYGVVIDNHGNFSGWAWGENIGWIHFRSETPVAYKVQTAWTASCIVDLQDLYDVALQWLTVEDEWSEPTADLDNSGMVDLGDVSELADHWMEQCPADWPLSE